MFSISTKQPDTKKLSNLDSVKLIAKYSPIFLITEHKGDLGLVMSKSKKVFKVIIDENSSCRDAIDQIKGEIYEALKTSY